MIDELRTCAHARPARTSRILLFHPASVEAGREFLGERWPDVAAIADPNQFFYRGVGRRRARLRDFIAPRVWWNLLRALLRGHFVGRPVGDPFVMPGLLLVRDAEVLREHPFRDIGDHPDLCAWLAATD